MPIASNAIVGGQAISGAAHPYVVALSYEGPFFKNCSGVVLEPRRILTSARCIVNGRSQISANKIYVHPASNGVVGPFGLILSPGSTASIQVSSYIIHPLNGVGLVGFGPYNLAILSLSADINRAPAYIYNGNKQFIGEPGTALGWSKETLPSTPLVLKQYVLEKLDFSVVDAVANFPDSLCYDSVSLTGTVYCGGFRNATNFLAFPQDQGAPMVKEINGKNVVIGILQNASHGQPFEGVFQYERYARVSSMFDFTLSNAPNTQFWSENGGLRLTITPMIMLLLLE